MQVDLSKVREFSCKKTEKRPGITDDVATLPDHLSLHGLYIEDLQCKRWRFSPDVRTIGSVVLLLLQNRKGRGKQGWMDHDGEASSDADGELRTYWPTQCTCYTFRKRHADLIDDR